MNLCSSQNSPMKSMRITFVLIIFLQWLTLQNIIPVPSSGLTYHWLGYVIGCYLVYVEFFWWLLKNYQAQILGYFRWFCLLFITTCIMDALGNLFFFQKFSWFDDLIHATTFSWTLTALFLTCAIALKHKYHIHAAWFLYYFAFSALILATVAHEYFEVSIDWLTQSTAGTASTDPYDAVRDLACNMVGGISFLLAYTFCKKCCHKEACGK